MHECIDSAAMASNRRQIIVRIPQPAYNPTFQAGYDSEEKLRGDLLFLKRKRIFGDNKQNVPLLKFSLMIKKQTWMAILATVVLLAGARLRRFARRDRSRQGGGVPNRRGPEKPEPEKPEPAPAFVLMLSEAEAMNFRISVESDDPQRNYFVGITTRADFDRLKTAQAVAETLVELEKGYGTIDWTTPDDQLIYRGNKTIDAGRIWSLKPKSDYAVVVFGVGAEGAITTDVFHDFISTTAVMPSQNRLSVSVAPESANVSVTTTNADPYFLDCIATSRPHPGTTDDLDKTFDRLYQELILRT